MKNKILLLSSIALISTALNATEIRPLISIELGIEGGTLDDDYSAPGYVSESYEHDYSGANFRLSGGIAIEHEDLESRLKVYFESSSGEIEFDSAFLASDEDMDSSEIGIAYELVFSQEGIQPFVGIELGVGSSELDVSGSNDVDYTSFGLYGGILYPINDNLEFTARIGYKARSYDDSIEYSPVLGSIVTEESDYSGIDLKIGLTYVF